MSTLLHFFRKMILYATGDTVILKKNHPCGCNRFKIEYCASDVKLKCENCGKDIILPRVKLDKFVKDKITNV